jgi:hypothetical protein
VLRARLLEENNTTLLLLFSTSAFLFLTPTLPYSSVSVFILSDHTQVLFHFVFPSAYTVSHKMPGKNRK